MTIILILMRTALIQLIIFTIILIKNGSSLDTDTINSSLVVRDNDIIVSSGKVFALGFFSPNGTTRRYVGIWYCVSPEIVPWIANRDSPLNDSSGSVSISSDGNLVVKNGLDEIVWSSLLPSPNSTTSNRTALLLDSGNLVLQDSASGSTIWESFRHPVETFLPNMRPSHNPRTGVLFGFNSWRSVQDPSHGDFDSGLYAVGIPQVYIWERNGTRPRWRSGPWNGRVFTVVTRSYSIYRNPFSLTTDEDGTVSIIWGGFRELIRIYLSPDGVLSNFEWNEGERDWNLTWAAPVNYCDFYNHCGSNAFCNIKASPICSCLRGYVPKNTSEWDRGIWEGGCVRRAAFQCENVNNGTKRSEGDGFRELLHLKVPDFELRVPGLENECMDECLRKCSCLAYAYDLGIGCMFWNGSLIDVQQFPDANAGSSFFVRVAHSELDKKNNHSLVFIFSGIGSLVALSLCSFGAWWICKRRGKKSLHANGSDTVNLDELPPLFSFEVLSKATDNFHLANKLGSGGFGPVFKGKLPNNKEIAVKRLSEISVQGFEEFMNEVIVISKLQHRNLVRLLGCCVEKEEKMLLYEYVQNGSLDFFLFGKEQNVLDWRKRRNIIEGIGRGLLYLHRDSRLKIIHRDLKPSNILLDYEWNPKISDFGTARIFGGNQEQDETGKVVGTYGYMAPEYVIGGRFSEKSDVYSFGVLVLEIVSGRKNTSFFNDWLSQSLSLVGHAWKLWNENNAMDLIDTRIRDPNLDEEMLRCVHIGLLCVQENYISRPSISTVLSMLSSEIVNLPTPARPGFTDSSWNTPSNEGSSYSNQMTVTMLEAR